MKHEELLCPTCGHEHTSTEVTRVRVRAGLLFKLGPCSCGCSERKMALGNDPRRRIV